MYSRWRKIDLHIHTDMSKETKENDYQGIFDIDVLYQKLLENNIDMISFTDHNIINIDAYNGINKKDIAVLVGVELDVAISEEDLEKYINKLNGVNNGLKIDIKPFHLLLIFKSQEFKKLSNDLEAMYGKISTDIFESKLDLVSKKKLRVTTFKYIVEAFKNEDYFLIAHGDKDKSIINPYKNSGKLSEAQSEILMGEISAVEMKSKNKMAHAINIYNEEFRKLVSSDFEAEQPTSYVVFSDNHNCYEYKCHRYCTWVKGALDYETLRIAFSDPESRIHTDEVEPTHSPYFVDKIFLKLKNGDSEEINLSPYLNVIIGGRASGKSLLFNSLIDLNQDFMSEDKKIFEEYYEKMVDKGETKIKLNIGGYESFTSIKGEAYYQEKIIDLFKQDSDLKDKLSEFFEDFNEIEVQNEEKQIEDLFKGMVKNYGSYYEKRSKIEKGCRLQLIKNSIKTSNKCFEINESELKTKYEIKYFSEIFNKINTIKEELKEINEIEFMNEKLFNKDDLCVLKNATDLLEQKCNIIEFNKNKTKNRTLFFDKVKDIYEDYLKKDLDTEKQSIEISKMTLNNDLEDYKKFMISKLQLKKACNLIEKLDKKVEDKRVEKERYIFVTKLNFKINKNKIIENLFESSVLNYDRNKSIYQNMVNMADPFCEVRMKNKTGLEGKKMESFKKKVYEFVDSCKSRKKYEILEKGNSPGDTPVSTATTSQGRKASIFLDIKLNSFLDKNAKHVLMIDQIEDNIDNKYISENLVNLIRKLKKKMQIILVTHNPSIAIYGDAENIIIAENNDNIITYKQGGLENAEIRKEACKILDGGDIAFKNRMDKYNIEKLKN